MKYRDPETGEFKELYTKAADTLPVGTVVDYDGDEVPAGWEAAGSDDYSLEETFTGKYWINGKKVYKKVVTGTFTGGSSTDTNIAYLGNVSIVSIQGVINNGAFIFPINNYYGLTTEYWVSVFFSNYTGHLNMNAGNEYENAPYTVIVEYTKPTD